MSNSYRDKKAHKARNPEKYFDSEGLPTIYGRVDWLDFLFKENIYPTKNTPSIAWSIQGKRRRNSTRKGNQKVKQIVHQQERSKLKNDLRNILNIEI